MEQNIIASTVRSLTIFAGFSAYMLYMLADFVSAINV